MVFLKMMWRRLEGGLLLLGVCGNLLLEERERGDGHLRSLTRLLWWSFFFVFINMKGGGRICFQCCAFFFYTNLESWGGFFYITFTYEKIEI